MPNTEGLMALFARIEAWQKQQAEHVAQAWKMRSRKSFAKNVKVRKLNTLEGVLK